MAGDVLVACKPNLYPLPKLFAVVKELGEVEDILCFVINCDLPRKLGRSQFSTGDLLLWIDFLEEE